MIPGSVFLVLHFSSPNPSRWQQRHSLPSLTQISKESPGITDDLIHFLPFTLGEVKQKNDLLHPANSYVFLFIFKKDIKSNNATNPCDYVVMTLIKLYTLTLSLHGVTEYLWSFGIFTWMIYEYQSVLTFPFRAPKGLQESLLLKRRWQILAQTLGHASS